MTSSSSIICSSGRRSPWGKYLTVDEGLFEFEKGGEVSTEVAMRLAVAGEDGGPHGAHFAMAACQRAFTSSFSIALKGIETVGGKLEYRDRRKLA